ncbi:MAG: exonuclease domain-containing protein [Firmicutes bacterium]|nr:exonuclease domain-containing protein [Bacillota bacterium]
MVYIILDLEWNSVYGVKIRGFINEIIEIGAVMLDERFREIGSFSVLVKSQIGKRLQAHVKEMTNISKKDLESGYTFDEAVAMFRAWIGKREHVALSWGDGDIRVLLSNTRYHTSGRALSYIQSYVDLQDYFRHRMHTSRSQQIGLAAAGELLGLDCTNYALHRALDDSRFAAQCLHAIYDPGDFPDFVRPCDAAFYAQLEYKPRVVSDINSPLVDKRQLYYICRGCGRPAAQATEWRFASRGFQAEFECRHCGARAKAMVTFKKMYNSVEIKRSAKELTGNEKPECRNEK